MSQSLRIGVDLRYPDIIFSRGMGRYTLQQLHTTIANSPQHHYYLFCLSHLATAIKPFLNYPNVTLCQHFTTYPLSEIARFTLIRKASEKHLEYYIHHYQLDIFYIPSLFHFLQPIPEGLTNNPILITVYDLIPYLFMDKLGFLGDLLQEEYWKGIAFIKKATHLIAISEATKQDVIRHLGYDEKRITVVYPALDKTFQRLDEQTIEQRLNGLWERLKLPRPNQYIFTVADHFYTKNLHTLIKGYSQLPQTVRDATPLVITFDIHPTHRAEFMQFADTLGVGNRVIFTHRVSEDELVALYNGATFTVYPSRYEGFGYPIVEAMACGSPVITTTASSMPEVAGDAALLVDPEDSESFTEAMYTLFQDSALRATLREKGLARYGQFNLENMAHQTLLAFEQFSANASKKPIAHFELRYRLILLALRIYVRVRWFFRYLKWQAYHKLYVPFKKHILRKN